LIGLLSQRCIRLYIEFAVPSSATAALSFGVTGCTPCPQFTRLVAVPSSTLWAGASSLKAFDILEAHACQYMPYWPAPGTTMQSHLALAKVAGFSTAVFGLNATEAQVPVLMTTEHHPGLLVAAVSLSHVRRGRYAPAASWMGLWRDMLRWLMFNEADDRPAPAWTDGVRWSPVVQPTYAASDALLATATKDALRRSLTWVHTTSGLLATQGALDAVVALGTPCFSKDL
jgi:hypothetical protein